MAFYDVAAADRQLFRDWCASHELNPAEATPEDVTRYLVEIPGARQTQIRRREAADQVRTAR